MAVVTLEEAKRYLRVDSADEDGFISARIWRGWKRKSWRGIFLWCYSAFYLLPNSLYFRQIQ